MINDSNSLCEMNARQMNVDPETGNEMNTKAVPVNHTYNLSPRPRRKIQDIS